MLYDVGRVLGVSWRPVLDQHVVRRELDIIKNDLHCNAVKICGRDLDRLSFATEYALTLGLEVWFSPELWGIIRGRTFLQRAANLPSEIRAGRHVATLQAFLARAVRDVRGVFDGPITYQVPVIGRFVRPRLRRDDYVRDEALQAKKIVENLEILEAAGVDGAFVCTFVELDLMLTRRLARPNRRHRRSTPQKRHGHVPGRRDNQLGATTAIST